MSDFMKDDFEGEAKDFREAQELVSSFCDLKPNEKMSPIPKVRPSRRQGRTWHDSYLNFLTPELGRSHSSKGSKQSARRHSSPHIRIA